MTLTPADLAQIQAMIAALSPSMVGEGFSDAIVAGQQLLIPAIQSPNFSLAGQTGWAIMKNGDAYFFNVVAEGSVTANSMVIEGSTGTFLIYSGTPALGNLIGSWAAVAGTDSSGNAYPAGISLGAAGGSQVLGNPSVNSAISLTSLITGIVQGALQLPTTDGSEVLPGDLAAVILGSGSTAKMATALTSPVGAGAGAALLLEAENDGGTDTAVITLGTTTTPDDSTIVFTPVMTLTPYALLLYGAGSGTVVVTKTSGSGTIAIPAGVTTAKAECWGGGGGGGGGASAGDGGGGGGGEYSAEPALAVTGGGTVAYSVGSGGAGSVTGGNGTAGANSTLTGTSATVTGHGGAGGTAGFPGTGGSGGSGYGGTTEHPGGQGGNGGGSNQGGGGAGSSAGPAAAGNAGAASHSSSGGAGGTAPTGGGAGGNGGADGGNGSNGSAPGGGGGGGGTGGGPLVTSGGNGKAGQVRLTYSTGTPVVLASIAAAAGTDQFGTAYPAGAYFTDSAGAVRVLGQTALVARTNHTISNTGLANLPWDLNGSGIPVISGVTYIVEGCIRAKQLVAAVADNFAFTGPAMSDSSLSWNFLQQGAAGGLDNTTATFIPSGTVGSPAYALNDTYVLYLNGEFTPSANGTFNGQGGVSVAGDNWQLITGSYVKLTPVS